MDVTRRGYISVAHRVRLKNLQRRQANNLEINDEEVTNAIAQRIFLLERNADPFQKYFNENLPTARQMVFDDHVSDATSVTESEATDTSSTTGPRSPIVIDLVTTESESEHEDAASADISGSEAAGPASSENSVQIIENRRDTDEPLVPVQGEGCRCAFCRPIFQADGQDSVSGSDSDEDEMQSAGSTGCRKRETKRPVSVEDAIDPDLMTTTPVVGLFDRDHGRPASALPDPFVADLKPEDLRPGPSGTSTPKPAVKRKYKALDCVTTTGPTESGLGTLANSAVTSSPVGRVTRSTQAWRSKRQRFKAIFCSSDTSDEEYGPTPPKEVEPGVGFGVESNLAKNAGTSLSEVGVQACPDNGDDGPRGIRFETSSSSGEDTDFENEEDIRALFNDGSDDWRERAENDPVLGNPRDPPRKVARSNHYVGKEKFDDFLDEAKQGILYADHGDKEKPEDLRHILNFPTRRILVQDPHDVFEELLIDAAKHHVVLKYVAKTWHIICLLYDLANRPVPPGYQTMRQRILARLPACTLHYTVMHKRTHNVRYIEGAKFNRKSFPARNYKPLVIETRANLKELLRFHADRHVGSLGQKMLADVETEQPINLYYYVDGVQPSTSGTWKMLCQVIKLECCNMFMNFSTIVYAKDHRLEADHLTEGLLAELNANPNVNVTRVIADMPERHRLTCMTNFNGEFGCTFCMSPGERRDGSPGMCWPYSTTQAVLRDDLSFEHLAAYSRQLGLPVGGQKHRSPLLNIPNFSITRGLVIDPMHLFYGLTRSFLEQFPKKYLTRAAERELNRKIGELYCALDLPRDFKREHRELDLGKWRANEFKQLLALCGLDIADEWEKLSHPEIADFWRRYTWIFRTLAQGDVWYQRASHSGKLVKANIDILYKQVEKLLGKNACSPNLHALHHIPEMRAYSRLGDVTAERAEDFYGKNREWFREQTHSVGKQIHINSLLAAKQGHVCRTTFNFRPKSKEGDMDHVMIDHRRRAYYYVGDADDEKFYRVRRLKCQQYWPPGVNLNLRECGILQVVGREDEVEFLEKSHVIAKGIIGNNSTLHTWTRDLQDI